VSANGDRSREVATPDAIAAVRAHHPSDRPMRRRLTGARRPTTMNRANGSVVTDGAAAGGGGHAIPGTESRPAQRCLSKSGHLASPVENTPSVLAHDRSEHPKTIRPRIEVAGPMQPGSLAAWHLRHDERRVRHPNIDESLYLEPVTPHHPALLGGRLVDVGEVHVRKNPPPARVVAVAQGSEVRLEQQIHEPTETGMAQPAQPRDVGATPTGQETRTLGKMSAVDKRLDEGGDLRRIGRSIGVKHHNDVARALGEATREGVALSSASLVDDDDRRPQL